MEDIFYFQSHPWMQAALVLLTVIVMNGLLVAASRKSDEKINKPWFMFISVIGTCFGSYLFMINVWLIPIAVLISEVFAKDMNGEIDVDYIYIFSTVCFFLMLFVFVLLHHVGLYEVLRKEILSNFGILAAFGVARFLYSLCLAERALGEGFDFGDERGDYEF